jgi:hypothetical protein
MLMGHHRGKRHDSEAEVEMFAAAIYTVKDGYVSHVAYYADRAFQAAGVTE